MLIPLSGSLCTQIVIVLRSTPTPLFAPRAHQLHTMPCTVQSCHGVITVHLLQRHAGRWCHSSQSLPARLCNPSRAIASIALFVIGTWQMPSGRRGVSRKSCRQHRLGCRFASLLRASRLAKALWPASNLYLVRFDTSLISAPLWCTFRSRVACGIKQCQASAEWHGHQTLQPGNGHVLMSPTPGDIVRL